MRGMEQDFAQAAAQRAKGFRLGGRDGLRLGAVSMMALMLAVAAPAAVPSPVFAQDAEDGEEEKEEEKTIASTVEDYERFDGLFPIYQDPENGDVYMEISADQLGKEYIYFSHTVDGPLAAGTFRGAFRDNRVFSIRKHFDKIEFVSENTRYYFDPENALSRASDANISPAILAVADIEVTDKAPEPEETPADDTGAGDSGAGDTGEGDSGEGDAAEATPERYLIKLSPILKSEDLHQVKPTPRPGSSGFSLGSLSGAKTKITDIRNYPENSYFVIDYVYDNPQPKSGGGGAVTDPRSVTVRLAHTLIEMPEDGFEPRISDHRVGYFTDRVDDLTSLEAVNYRDKVNRWRLEKKDPEAALSEPVEPITFWLENTTPEEFREPIRKATLAWNEAFEEAGFKNAIAVEIQPDDADWDAGDIRYNVIRWTSSPQPPFGGYGPSFTNPRTGEILGADIMLEWVFVTNRVALSNINDATASLMEMGAVPADVETPAFATNHAAAAHAKLHDAGFCSAGHHLKLGLAAGLTAARIKGLGDAAEDELVKQGIYYLTLHEVGHTLGLTHNMQASQMLGADEIHDRAKAEEIGLISSVMDYPAVNLAPEGVEQGLFYTTKPGPYDKWAIAFGYTPDLDGEARDALLARSMEPELAYGNDADDMRSPGRGIDPRIMINDLSGDAVDYAIERMEMVRSLMGDLKLDMVREGETFQELLQSYLLLVNEQARAATVVSRYVGGVQTERYVAGQPGAPEAAFTPVPGDEQRAAVEALAAYLFAPDAFDAPADLVAHLQPQRRGFDFFRGTEEPEIHAIAVAVQGGVLSHLLHPRVLERMTDSRLYGNDYTVAEMLTDLTDAVFAADKGKDVNTFRQNLQVAYVQRLAAIAAGKAGGSYDHVARSAVLSNLKRIERMTRPGLFQAARSPETLAHREHLRFLIDKALDA